MGVLLLACGVKEKQSALCSKKERDQRLTVTGLTLEQDGNGLAIDKHVAQNNSGGDTVGGVSFPTSPFFTPTLPTYFYDLLINKPTEDLNFPIFYPTTTTSTATTTDAPAAAMTTPSTELPSPGTKMLNLTTTDDVPPLQDGLELMNDQAQQLLATATPHINNLVISLPTCLPQGWPNAVAKFQSAICTLNTMPTPTPTPNLYQACTPDGVPDRPPPSHQSTSLNYLPWSCFPLPCLRCLHPQSLLDLFTRGTGPITATCMVTTMELRSRNMSANNCWQGQGGHSLFLMVWSIG